ncbi:chaperone modulator CbpM [Azospirillum sp. ST 5-10]|uniref:chaperone modulator CbpM n=1 Tax=unclassified Azospirillum TaxID=2630922 RepID=UPI003F4A04CE
MSGIGFDEALAACRRVSRGDLTLWIERHWVRPHGGGGAVTFTAIDLARIELICDLRQDLDLDDDTVPLVLSLLDTVHGLRRRLTVLARAIGHLPPEARAALAEEVRRLETSGE